MPVSKEETKNVGSAKNRPNVFLVVDTYDWAFHRIAKQIAKHYKDEFNFQIMTFNEYHHVPEQDIDLLISFWWGLTGLYRKNKRIKRIVPCLYDEFTWLTAQSYLREACRYADGFVFSSDRIYDKMEDIFSDIPNKKYFICEDGVDLDLFKVQPYPEIFTVGWAGNTKAGKVKGFNYVEELMKMSSLPFILAEKQSSHIVFEEMPDRFYKNISALLITSESEGTPNPALEAAASGKMIISTDVGIVRKVISEGKNGIIVKDRNINSFSNALEQCQALDKETASSVSRELASFMSWDRNIKSWESVLKLAYD